MNKNVFEECWIQPVTGITGVRGIKLNWEWGKQRDSQVVGWRKEKTLRKTVQMLSGKESAKK